MSIVSLRSFGCEGTLFKPLGQALVEWRIAARSSLQHPAAFLGHDWGLRGRCCAPAPSWQTRDVKKLVDDCHLFAR